MFKLIWIRETVSDGKWHGFFKADDWKTCFHFTPQLMMHNKSTKRSPQTHTAIFVSSVEISFGLHFYVITHPGEQQEKKMQQQCNEHKKPNKMNRNRDQRLRHTVERRFCFCTFGIFNFTHLWLLCEQWAQKCVLNEHFACFPLFSFHAIEREQNSNDDFVSFQERADILEMKLQM